MSYFRSTQAGIVLVARICLIIAGLCFFDVAGAQTEIHRCTDPDGGVVFSQLPCPAESPAKPEEAASGREVETAAPEFTDYESPLVEESQNPARSEEEVAACQKPIRDAIDAIDAEIGREYTPEKADEFKQRLLELTRQLRQC